MVKFTLDTRFVSTLPVVVISGDLTGQNVSMISSELSKYLQSESAAVAMDLSGMTFIDSQGIGIFIYCSELFRKKQKRIYLLNPKTFIRNMLKDMSLDTVFRIFDSEQQMLEMTVS
jgi:anti-anti-sigma factor